MVFLFLRVTQRHNMFQCYHNINLMVVGKNCQVSFLNCLREVILGGFPDTSVYVQLF